MMLPSPAPMLLVFTTINERRRERADADQVDTAAFALAYVVSWLTGAGLVVWGVPTLARAP